MVREPKLPAVKVKPRIPIPAYVPASPEEIARRRALAARVDRLRESMPVVAKDAADLVRQDRDEHGEDHG